MSTNSNEHELIPIETPEEAVEFQMIKQLREAELDEYADELPKG